MFEKLLSFASLISNSKIILFERQCQAFDTVFHHQMKHLEIRQKYSAARRIGESLATRFAALTHNLSPFDGANKIKTLNIERA